VDEEPTGGPDDEIEAAARRDEQRAEDAIVDLPWDDDLPVALGDDVGDEEASGAGERRVAPGEPAATAGHDADEPVGADGDPGEHGERGGDDRGDDRDDDPGDDMGYLYEDDHVAGRRNALPRRVESWRSRSATGAIATAIAMGLQQVFEPERRRPAAVAEAPSDPYDDDDPITVDYVPDDAEGTTVHVKPWLLQKGEPG
jgi:hypothetical protein